MQGARESRVDPAAPAATTTLPRRTSRAAAHANKTAVFATGYAATSTISATGYAAASTIAATAASTASTVSTAAATTESSAATITSLTIPTIHASSPSATTTSQSTLATKEREGCSERSFGKHQSRPSQTSATSHW